MKIEGFFKTVQSYEKLCEIAEKSVPKISFWGAEYLVVEGYDGYLGIDAIVNRLFEIIKKNYEFNETERFFGKRISSRMNCIYEKSDEIYKTCNIFTRILVFIRGLFGPDFTRRAWDLYDEKSVFEYYTKAQFTNVFGYPPEEANERGIRLNKITDLQQRWRIRPNPAN
jgi:hypothetical protein